MGRPRNRSLFIAALALALAVATPWAASAPQTVCTVTVNSPDEKEVLRRFLPDKQARFVELVAHDRPDWLASACQASVACDVLVVSGHFDGVGAFFSDRPEAHEQLSIAELERVSCSQSCPALFAQLKEVYLFGCNTLNPYPQGSATADVVRDLVRQGWPPHEAVRHWTALMGGHGQSSRDRMRQVFNDVPVIYGFSRQAPVGPVAAAALTPYLRQQGAAEFGQGRPSTRLQAAFASYGMTVARGVTAQDAQASARRDMCRFADDRLSPASKLDFVSELLHRDSADARTHLERIERLADGLDGDALQAPATAQALSRLARDGAARSRLLGLAHEDEQAAVRARLITLARDLTGLSAVDSRDEWVLLFTQLLARSDVGVADVELACQLNRAQKFKGVLDRLPTAPAAPTSPTEPGAAAELAQAAVRACLGSVQGRTQTLQGLLRADEAQVRLAQAYLRHHPVRDAAELRRLASGITRMPASAAQVRALDALGRHYVANSDILQELLDLYSRTDSWSVQVAVAGVLMRADEPALAQTDLLHILEQRRLPAPADENTIDLLLRRLRAP